MNNSEKSACFLQSCVFFSSKVCFFLQTCWEAWNFFIVFIGIDALGVKTKFCEGATFKIKKYQYLR